MLANNLSTTPPIQLSDNYYLDNFRYLIRFVEEHYSHLLSAQEVQFCSGFNTFSDGACKLYVRLALRTHELLRMSKVQYPEISSIPDTMAELVKQQFISQNIKPDIVQCQTLFTRQELKSTGIAIVGDESDNDNSSHWLTPDLFGQSPLERLLDSDSIIEVHHKDLIVNFRLLFFGNLHQDFSSFVLRDLGLRRYESYTIDSDTLLFQSREQLQAHLDYYLCAECFDTACELGTEGLTELHKRLPSKITGDRSLTRRLDNFNNKIARQLERESAFEQAADIYAETTLPPARERLTRLYAKRGETTEALSLCRQIIESPHDSDELDFATGFGQKLALKTERPFPTENKYKPPESLLALPKSRLSVEFAVATHLAKTGKCYYLENNLITGVFGLAFWDIIFAPLNGVFFHPFQSRPTDFYEPGFVRDRQELINKRLKELSEGKLSHYVNFNFYHKRDIQNPMVNWRMCRKHILDLALKRIPSTTWTGLFTQLLNDIRNYKSGQPDLIYFPDDGGYQFIEVKAPGDKLQKNQLRWMKSFERQNIAHLVVNVKWLESSCEAH